MSDVRLSRVVVAGVTSAVVAFVASFAVVATPTGVEHVYATGFVWSVLVVGFTAINVEPARLPRFAVVFCGSLVGLSVLFGALVDYRLLDAALGDAATAGLAFAVNPVMAVLVGGALVLSFYGVFQCGCGASERDGRSGSDQDGRTA